MKLFIYLIVIDYSHILLYNNRMETIAISEFKATCLRLLERVRRSGEPILITKNGEPCALVGPPPAEKMAKTSYYGKLRDKAEIVGDIISPTGENWNALKD